MADVGAGEEARFKWQDGCGLVGVFLAIAGMADMPLGLRLCFFAACAIGLPLSFSSHKHWALSIRWVLSAAVVCLMAYMSYHASHIVTEHVPTASEIAKETFELERKGQKLPFQTETAPPLKTAPKTITQPSKSGFSAVTQEVPILLSVELIDPLNPSIRITNNSTKLAEAVTWEYVAFRDLELTTLSFATQSYGYIKPHSIGAVYEMPLSTIPKFTDGNPVLVEGDSFTGSLSVDCPKCKGETYIVHLEWRKSDWFSEMKNIQGINDLNGHICAPRDPSKAGIAAYLKILNRLADEHGRQPILTRQP